MLTGSAKEYDSDTWPNDDDNQPSTSTATPSTSSFSSPPTFSNPTPRAALEKFLAILNQKLEGKDEAGTSTAPLLSSTSSLSETKESEQKHEQKSDWDKMFDLFNNPAFTEASKDPLPLTEDPVTSSDKFKKFMDLFNEQPENTEAKPHRSWFDKDVLLKFSTSLAETEEATVEPAKALLEAVLLRKMPKISLGM